MKIVEQAAYKEYLFTCPECGAYLKARGTEFEFLKPGLLGCVCPKCKKQITVRERRIEILPVYVDFKGD